MKRAFVLMAVVLLVLGLALGREEWAEAEHDENHEIAVFDRNVRIGFRMASEEGQAGEPAFIVTAIPKYKMMTEFENGDKKAMVSVSGAVDILEDDQILVLLEAEMEFDGEERETDFGVTCAVRLRSGEEQEIARLGDTTLIVNAEYID